MSKKSSIDIYISNYITKMLVTPFKLWPAYKFGIINSKGDILKDYTKLSVQEREIWGFLDIILCNLKKQLENTPQRPKISSYQIFAKNYLTHTGLSSKDVEVSLRQNTIPGKVYLNIKEDEGVPVNNIGDGNIAKIDPSLLTRAKSILKRKKNKEISYKGDIRGDG